MLERRALERIAINQPAMLCVDGIRGCHPCLVVNLHRNGATLHSSTHHTAAFRFDLSLEWFQNDNALPCGVAERRYLRRQICRSKRRSRSERPALNGVFKRFYDPIVLPDGPKLLTLRDASEYIAALPKAEHDSADWQVAMETLLLVAERNGPEMLARIGANRPKLFG